MTLIAFIAIFFSGNTLNISQVLLYEKNYYLSFMANLSQSVYGHFGGGTIQKIVKVSKIHFHGFSQ